ncbi:hypothetical protein NLJ89_g10074 [Agrocybe chaxingu]|uniref:Uncharacterized protein n=1 Tax=Agrocybe chaxingu TaxID=84603 RepID=A0A9W8MR89_9AGAR|nr:hypothetical protein NLJ89_g10074 [Agrocybe chaxingu]
MSQLSEVDVGKRVKALNESIFPQCAQMPYFLGNLDFPNDFYQVAPEGRSTYEFRCEKTKEPLLVGIVGQVAAGFQGTKLGAIGNFNAQIGKVNKIKITDKTNVKDVLRLIVPIGADLKSTAIFNNQIPPLNQVFAFNIAEDNKPNRVEPVVVHDWLDSSAAHDAENRKLDMITITLPRKFAAPQSADSQKVLQSIAKRSTQRMNVTSTVTSTDSADVEEQPQPSSAMNAAPEPVLGGYYNPMLLPDYSRYETLFDLTKNQLVQHDVHDTEKQLIPAWKLAEGLHAGTVVLVLGSLHVFNIDMGVGKGFRRIYQINAEKVRVLMESTIPYQPPSFYGDEDKSTVKTSPSASLESKTVKDFDNFESFTMKKRSQVRKTSTAHNEDIAPGPSKHSTRVTHERGKEKADDRDVQMNL